MDLYLGKFTIPVSGMYLTDELLFAVCCDCPVTVALQLFNTLAVLLLVPVFDKVIYPALQTRGFRLRMLTKIGAVCRTCDAPR